VRVQRRFDRFNSIRTTRSSGFPLLALDGPIRRNAEKIGLSLVELDLRSSTRTQRQRLAEVLEETSREGEVQIRCQDGRVYAVTPVEKPAQSPFANVTGRAVKGVASKDLIEQSVGKDGHVAHVRCAAPEA
jgi:hypothetical protein